MREVRAAVGPGVAIAVDPNQAWDLDESVAMSELLAPYEPEWLEEPLLADADMDQWIELARRSPVPLATGENLRGDKVFDAHIASGAFKVIQPDPVKWGGLSGLRRIGRRVSEAGLRFCPHYLGSGLGLVATGHLAAAVGSQTSLLEIDQNENPLRESLAFPYPTVEEGRIRLPDGPGIGIEPDLGRGSRYLVCKSA
jgi:D-galactarolactone cycloisomerase